MYFLGKLPTSLFPPTYMDWFYLILLSLLCTTLAQVLALKALDHISAFASNLVVNLEPVYGIILAVILLNEHHKLDPMFYVGGSIILISVLLYPYLNKRINLQKPI
jgi:drug/metabolite transporter (DMT)-like permease